MSQTMIQTLVEAGLWSGLELELNDLLSHLRKSFIILCNNLWQINAYFSFADTVQPSSACCGCCCCCCCCRSGCPPNVNKIIIYGRIADRMRTHRFWLDGVLDRWCLIKKEGEDLGPRADTTFSAALGVGFWKTCANFQQNQSKRTILRSRKQLSKKFPTKQKHT